MNVWLVDFDGKIENLALMRIAAYHKAQGDKVSLKHGAFSQMSLFEPLPDKVYVSCLFSWNRKDALRYFEQIPCDKEIGGTGIDPTISLPDYIEAYPPDYQLYGRNRAIGFISRGCFRKCPWCVVPSKEGKLHRISSAQEICGNFKEAIFLDNNFLKLPDAASDLNWLAENKIATDFNQGLDARLVTPELAKLLARLKWSSKQNGPRFSLDAKQSMKAVGLALERLRDAGISPSRVFVYCLIGFDGFESDVSRLLFLRENGVRVFPMRYRNLETGESPATGWNKRLYHKYNRLIGRMPFANSVWDDFRREIIGSAESPPQASESPEQVFV